MVAIGQQGGRPGAGEGRAGDKTCYNSVGLMAQRMGPPCHLCYSRCCTHRADRSLPCSTPAHSCWQGLSGTQTRPHPVVMGSAVCRRALHCHAVHSLPYDEQAETVICEPAHQQVMVGAQDMLAAGGRASWWLCSRGRRAVQVCVTYSGRRSGAVAGRGHQRPPDEDADHHPGITPLILCATTPY